MTHPFIDEVKFTARGGDGGDGCSSFESQPYQPHGGPDGGNGGPGGDVVLEASDSLSTLAEFNHLDRIKAEDGSAGGPDHRRGASGSDKVVKVPVGTAVYHRKTNEKIADLTKPEDRVVVARGGEGGRGNSCFASSGRQKPRFHEYGARGENIPLRLELKLLADAGLVGLPNAGKSTLLSKITGAHPKIAEHPFTTKKPNLGVLFDQHRRMTICDIPGLIEEAHQGAGLGIQFLKHIDRTRLLVHLVDISSPTPVQDFNVLRAELKAYDPGLMDKTTLVAVNKIDLVDSELVDLFLEEISPLADNVVLISAREETNLDEFQKKLWKCYDKAEADPGEKEEKQERVVKMEPRQPLEVTPADGRYLLKGDRVTELLERFDLTNPDALSYVRMRLLEMGLHKKLEKAGCKPGDTVQVGNQEFKYTG